MIQPNDRKSERNSDSKANAPARVAIDLGAESCRVSLLRWQNGRGDMELVQRSPNGPVHVNGSLHWNFDAILTNIEEGLCKCSRLAPEGIASIAVDGWAVDYVRFGADGKPIAQPYCYRDERTVPAKEAADRLAGNEWMFRHTGAQPLRINTVYQLLADHSAGIDPHTSWLNLPEYVLFRLGGRRVAEYTNATHTGLVDIETGDWSQSLLNVLDLSPDGMPPIVPSGTILGKVVGSLSRLPAFRNTDLIAPACHDTASAIAGIPTPLNGTAYICSGTWSLVGTLVAEPITSSEAMAASFTNQGAAGGGFCFHTNVNGMWILKQCLDVWRRNGRSWELPDLISQAAAWNIFPGVIAVDAPPLLLDGDMPELINQQLKASKFETIPDVPGNEPLFARVIIESLAHRYASALRDLEKLLGKHFTRIHILGGGSRNYLLRRLTAEHTGLPVETGNVESSTIGNFAVQMAACESGSEGLTREKIRKWAVRLSREN